MKGGKRSATKKDRGRGGGSSSSSSKATATGGVVVGRRRQEAEAATTNRPRNLLVLDATSEVSLGFSGPFASHCQVLVRQSPDEETWPGGALWDLGVLLAQVLVALASAGGGRGSAAASTLAKAPPTTTQVTLTMASTNPPRPFPGSKSSVRGFHQAIELPARVVENVVVRERIVDASGLIVLELGCGVGLTGLAAAAAFRAGATVLTDLACVIDRITQPNVELNRASLLKGAGPVAAVPLCWGDAQDEAAVLKLLQSLDPAFPPLEPTGAPSAQPNPLPRHRNPRASRAGTSPRSNLHHSPGLPDLILVGDVAYQHKPGAPSHFEALVSTLLLLAPPEAGTLVVFGTRLRMPASSDLLDLLLHHFHQIVEPPLRADEVNGLFRNVKHNMTIHFLQRKKTLPSVVSPTPHRHGAG